MKVNTNSNKMFTEVDAFMTQVETILQNNTTSETISSALGLEMASFTSATPIPALDAIHEKVLTIRAEVGARQNRVELMGNRLSIQEVNVTKQMSLNEDTDYAKAITDMATTESIHQAALSVGAKIIQQTLVDFIR